MSDFCEEIAQFSGLESGDFQEGIQRILTYLQGRYGFGLWMFTRVEDNDWIVVSASDKGYDVKAGDLFKWSDSFCSRMVAGLGPQIAPDSDLVPAYASAEIGQQVPIRTYIGVPVSKPDGKLFGTLCAIDPAPKDPEICSELPLLNMFGELISGMVESEIKAQVAARQAQAAAMISQTDSLTLLGNRRAWTECIEQEEARASRLASPTGVIIFDLDDLKLVNDSQGHSAGDQLLVKFAEILQVCVGDAGCSFRIGGDEFACLLPNADPNLTRDTLMDIRNALDQAGIRASSGAAMRHPSKNLTAAWEVADREMYRDKERRSAKLAA